MRASRSGMDECVASPTTASTASRSGFTTAPSRARAILPVPTGLSGQPSVPSLARDMGLTRSHLSSHYRVRVAADEYMHSTRRRALGDESP